MCISVLPSLSTHFPVADIILCDSQIFPVGLQPAFTLNKAGFLSFPLFLPHLHQLCILVLHNCVILWTSLSYSKPWKHIQSDPSNSCSQHPSSTTVSEPHVELQTWLAENHWEVYLASWTPIGSLQFPPKYSSLFCAPQSTTICFFLSLQSPPSTLILLFLSVSSIYRHQVTFQGSYLQVFFLTKAFAPPQCGFSVWEMCSHNAQQISTHLMLHCNCFFIWLCQLFTSSTKAEGTTIFLIILAPG